MASTTRRSGWAVLALASACSSSASGPAGGSSAAVGPPLVIGISISLSGDVATLASPALRDYKLWASTVNSKGGQPDVLVSGTGGADAVAEVKGLVQAHFTPNLMFLTGGPNDLIFPAQVGPPPRLRRTILLVEQNARSALGIAHHGAVLDAGSVVLTAPATELLDSPDVGRLYLGAA